MNIDKTFVTTNICRDKHNFVATKVLLCKYNFCLDKKRYLWQLPPMIGMASWHERLWHGARAMALDSQVKHDGAWSPYGWVTVACYSASNSIFLRSQILCSPYTIFSETINRGPLVYKPANRSPSHSKGSVIHVRVRWILRTRK